MALNLDALSLWEIAHRWADVDPERARLRIPLSVRDWIRTMLDAILNRKLSCVLELEKEKIRAPDFPKECSVYHWLDDIYAARAGQKYSKRMLRFIEVDQWDLADWCDKEGIPKPAFWFPVDWKPPANDQSVQDLPEPKESKGASAGGEINSGPVDGDRDDTVKLRPSTRTKIACQEVAKILWKDDPTLTIAAVMRHEIIQKYCGAQHYADAVVRRYVKEVAPPEVSQKRGKPRKKASNPPDK